MHGWGFDRSIWQGIAARLPEHELHTADRGYFGEQSCVAADEPFVALGHSLGALLLIEAGGPSCRGIIAINGFDRFIASADDPAAGVPGRMLERMIARLAVTPEPVVSDFRARCGAPPASAVPNVARLAADLVLLRDTDVTGSLAGGHRPILSLHGATDWLLSTGHREAAFRNAPCVQRETHPGAGHDLPWARPGWCADRIRGFVSALA